MGKIISLSILILLILAGCSVTVPQNRNSLSPEAQKASASSDIHRFREEISTNKIPPMILPSVYQNISPLNGKTVTLSSENANLRQVLYIISQTAGLNLILGTDIDTNATITLTLNQASIEEALDVVSDLSGCSYTLKGNMLYVKQYSQRTFSIPYIHTNSSFDSTVGGDILGGGTTSGLTGKFALNYKNPSEANDFYKQLEVNIKEILSPNGRFTLNKFTGTLIVTDTKTVLDTIAEMLKKIKKTASRQVHIEAKILEVVLNETHDLGVDWNTLSKTLSDFSFTQTLGLSSAVAGQLGYSDRHLSAIMKVLDTAGDVQTLSNPNIKVSSGQSALISSGKLVPYWDKQVIYTPSISTTGTSINTPLTTYTRRDVLDGLSLGVTPTITEDGQIILNIVPVTSSIEGEKINTDMGSQVGSAPILNIKEAGTIIYARDNEMVLIGGLISNTKKDNRSSVPLLGSIPYLGALFSRIEQTNEKRELVILLKLNMVE